MTRNRPAAPPDVRWITRKLEGAGFDTWAVGGAVRDAVLGRPSEDWDLATRATPTEMRRLFRRTVPLGVEHGTVGILSEDGVMYEVTTFRRDVETDGRHAVVAFADTVEEDLARRDFTINALAWHPIQERMLDPFHGLADLEEGCLRAVGEPGARFAEDRLRVLRAFRFASRFGLRVDPATWTALRDEVPHLGRLSAERIRDELIKVLETDPAPSRALELYREAGALAVLYPELEAVAADGTEGWAAALAAVDHLPPGAPLRRLAALLRPVEAKAAAQLLVRMRLSNAQTDETARQAAAPPLPGPEASDADFRRWLAAVGPARLTGVARLQLAAARSRGDGAGAVAVVRGWRRARAVLGRRPPLTVGELALDGRDLMALGLRPGPRFGLILDALLEWVLEVPERNEGETLRAEAGRLALEQDPRRG